MKKIDLKTWHRATQYKLFRTYDRPHYAVTCRMDVTRLMANKDKQSLNHACLFAIGAGIHAVSPLLLRLDGNDVIQHDAAFLSTTVPKDTGGFNYTDITFHPDFATFAAAAAAQIAQAEVATDPGIHTDPSLAVTYLSCLPWLDYTSINNAIRNADDCIPRVSWGKIVPTGDQWQMAMTLEVHHALVDGADVGAYFETVQKTLDRF